MCVMLHLLYCVPPPPPPPNAHSPSNELMRRRKSAMLLRTFLCPSSHVKKKTPDCVSCMFCENAIFNGHFSVHRAYAKTKAILLQTFSRLSSLCQGEKRHFVTGMFCKKAILLRTFLCPSSPMSRRQGAVLLRNVADMFVSGLCPEEKAPFCFARMFCRSTMFVLCPSRLFQEERMPFCYGHFCVHRAYAKKKKSAMLLRRREREQWSCHCFMAPAHMIESMESRRHNSPKASWISCM